MAKNDFKMAAIRHLEFVKKFIIWSFAVMYKISSKSDDFFVELLRFHDFQDGGSSPS